MMTLANELEAHGYGDEADDAYRGIVQWYAGTQPSSVVVSRTSASSR